MLSCLAFLLLSLQALTDLPAARGVYAKQGGGTWIALQKAAITETKATGLDLYVATGGYTTVGVECSIEGAGAAVRLAGPRPEFRVREVGQASEATLIRLAQKKNKRTFQTSFADSTVGNKAGFRKDDIRKIAVAVNPDSTFSVRLEGDLAPGEYLLVLGGLSESYDFGVEAKKQVSSP
jgi:hypothetical protein